MNWDARAFQGSAYPPKLSTNSETLQWGLFTKWCVPPIVPLFCRQTALRGAKQHSTWFAGKACVSRQVADFWMVALTGIEPVF